MQDTEDIEFLAASTGTQEFEPITDGFVRYVLTLKGIGLPTLHKVNILISREIWP
jgi:hypothetical protein